ncbi:hypothetical protein STEG23_001498, partial [Scotinomys teguina]
PENSQQHQRTIKCLTSQTGERGSRCVLLRGALYPALDRTLIFIIYLELNFVKSDWDHGGLDEEYSYINENESNWKPFESTHGKLCMIRHVIDHGDVPETLGWK